MAKKGEYRINDIYQGGYSSFNSDYGNFVGYHIPAGDIGQSTDARTANILKEVNDKINPGGTTIELNQVFPEVFDAVPKQQLEEVKRLSKLTGVDITFHAPIVGLDPSGMDKQGQFSEMDRRAVERQMIEAVKRGHELNPDGNIPITFHASQGPPGSLAEPTKEGEKITKRLIAINKETKRLAPLIGDIKHYPDMKKMDGGKLIDIPLEKGEYYSPERQLKVMNETEWDNSIDQIMFNKERADEILQRNEVQISHLLEDINSGKVNQETLRQFPEQARVYNHFMNAKTYLDDTYKTVNGLFSKAYEYGNSEQKNALIKVSNEFKKDLEKVQDPMTESQVMQSLILKLKSPQFTPQMYVPIEEFVTQESGKTFGNIAYESYKKFKGNSPIINIENSYSGSAISSGEELKKVIEEARKNFVINAKSNGMSESEAKNLSEKFIGATWDLGRLNTLRKQGFSEKDIIRETEKIAPLVKHVHLSDNFGFEGTEIPMGMGNVPVKEIMQKLGEKGFEGKKVIEAMHWWQHFSPQGSMPNSPLKPTLEAFGSPIYSMQMAPYWNQSIGLQQDYLTQNVPTYSQYNQQLFGTSFSQLPMDLGGQMPGQGGRMSGRPME